MGVIVVAPNSPDSVTFAARELQSHVSAISGATLPIYSEEDLPQGANVKIVVALGDSRFARSSGVVKTGLKDDGFRIKEANDAMVIIGNDYAGAPLGDRNGQTKWTYNESLKLNAHGETGTLYGVYRFLNELGVRWFMPGSIGTVIPRSVNITYDGKSIEDWPHFSYRRLSGFSFNEDPEAAIWYRRVGFGSKNYINLNHSFTNWAKRFGDTNREFFAKIDGKNHIDIVSDERRVILNYTEPGVFDQVIRDVDTYFKNHSEEKLFPIVPNDSHVLHDTSAATMSFIDPEKKYSPGWLSNLVWTFVNNVALRTHQKFPGKLVGSLAYSYQFEAPTTIENFSPNVVIMHCRRRNAFWDIKYREYVRRNLEAFTRLGPAKQYIWEYYNLRSRGENFQFIPFVMPHIIADDIRSLKNVSSGEFIQARQSNRSMKLVNPGYFHLNLFVTAQALWDPDLDIEGLLSDYYDTYYGPAASDMRRFWGRLEEVWVTQNREHDSIKPMSPRRRAKLRQREWHYYWSSVYTVEVVDELLGYLDDALVRAKPSREYSERVRFMRSQFDPMRSMARRFAH